jgi:hypothetical protein
MERIAKLSGSTPSDTVCTSLSAANFNEFFASIGHNVTSHLPSAKNLLWKGPDSIYTFNFNVVQEAEVLKLLKQLSLISSNDILDFDCKLLRIASNHIVKELTYIFNRSLQNGIVPDDWKFARVTPIYKGKGPKNDAVNYRPISVLSFVSRIVEKLVQCQFMNFLVCHQFITLDQYAYRKYHSTTNCLHTTIDEWLQNMDDKLLTGVCFLDIAKCFDTIDHDLLLQKLRKYGVHDGEQQWFQSYLNNRSQRVFFNNVMSDSVDISIGVPQGSTLGPLLFMVFVNDLPLYINKGRCTMYADDTMLYINDENIADVTLGMNDVLKGVSEWYYANRLVLNVDKSQSMLIGKKTESDIRNDFAVVLNGVPVERVQNTKYLGLHIDENLKFDSHINELIKKLSAKLSWFSRLRHIVTRDILILTYKTYIQPIIDYACTVWGCSNAYVNLIQRFQNRAARIVCSNFDIVNTRGEDLVRQLKWQTIQQRINYFLSTQMYNCIHGNAPDYLVNSIVMACEASDVNTRVNDTLNVQVPFCRTDIMKRSFIYRGSKVWNDIPRDIQEATNVKEFKCHIKKLYTP